MSDIPVLDVGSLSDNELVKKLIDTVRRHTASLVGFNNDTDFSKQIYSLESELEILEKELLRRLGKAGGSETNNLEER